MLSQYSADYFARSPVLAFPLLALGIFLIVFVVVSLRALLQSRSQVDHMACLPLEGTEETRHV
jgi:hypothetical protein